MKQYAQKEIGKAPKHAKKLKIKSPHGGHYVAWVWREKANDNGMSERGTVYRLAMGDGRDEPIFEFRHNFRTELEAELYAEVVTLNEAIE